MNMCSRMYIKIEYLPTAHVEVQVVMDKVIYYDVRRDIKCTRTVK